MSVGIGAAAEVMLDGYPLSGYVRTFDPTAAKDVLDANVFGVGWRKKVLGLKHATLSAVALYDDTANTGSWDVLKSKFLPGAVASYLFGPQGFAASNRILAVYGELVRFKPQSVIDDLIKIMIDVEAAQDAADLGVSLHGLTAETSLPFTGTGVDHGAATTNGGLATVGVSEIAGAAPSVIYRVQHSSNGSTWVDLVVFTAITSANSFQRVAVAAGTTVNRHLRTTITENGTTASVTGLVTFSRR